MNSTSVGPRPRKRLLLAVFCGQRPSAVRRPDATVVFRRAVFRPRSRSAAGVLNGVCSTAPRRRSRLSVVSPARLRRPWQHKVPERPPARAAGNRHAHQSRPPLGADRTASRSNVSSSAGKTTDGFGRASSARPSNSAEQQPSGQSSRRHQGLKRPATWLRSPRQVRAIAQSVAAQPRQHGNHAEEQAAGRRGQFAD